MPPGTPAPSGRSPFASSRWRTPSTGPMDILLASFLFCWLLTSQVIHRVQQCGEHVESRPMGLPARLCSEHTGLGSRERIELLLNPWAIAALVRLASPAWGVAPQEQRPLRGSPHPRPMH